MAVTRQPSRAETGSHQASDHGYREPWSWTDWDLRRPLRV